MFVIPVDGSDNALKPQDYLDLVFGPNHNLKVILFYVLPRLSPILVEESRKIGETLQQLKNLEARNVEIAERLLANGKKRLVAKGFVEKTVEAVFRRIEVGVARDIVNWSEKKRAEAVIISTRGHSKLAAFFLVKGADYLVDGISVIARRLNVSDLIIGLTVVAFGTSTSELFIDIFVGAEGNTKIAIGNVLGSNISNVFLILSVSAIIYPLVLSGKKFPMVCWLSSSRDWWPIAEKSLNRFN
jgi:hypothetical protein